MMIPFLCVLRNERRTRLINIHYMIVQVHVQAEKLKTTESTRLRFYLFLSKMSPFSCVCVFMTTLKGTHFSGDTCHTFVWNLTGELWVNVWKNDWKGTVWFDFCDILSGFLRFLFIKAIWWHYFVFLSFCDIYPNSAHWIPISLMFLLKTKYDEREQCCFLLCTFSKEDIFIHSSTLFLCLFRLMSDNGVCMCVEWLETWLMYLTLFLC